MALTIDQLRSLGSLIRDHHAGLVVELFGPQASDLTKAEIERLVGAGIVTPAAAKALTVDMVGDVMSYGMLQIHLEQLAREANRRPPDTDALSYDDVRARLERDPVPMTPAQVDAVDFARAKAGELMTQLGDRVAGKVVADGMSAESELQIVRDEVERNIARRGGVRTLASDLGHATGDWSRDWDRVARTEVQEASTQGRASQLAEQYGDDARVAKVPNPGACPVCERVYLDTKTGKPIIWKLSELQGHGTNRGLKQPEWIATLGTVHPNCHCRLVYVGEGWEFDDEWTLRVQREPEDED